MTRTTFLDAANLRTAKPSGYPIAVKRGVAMWVGDLRAGADDFIGNARLKKAPDFYE